jgi:pimeloyl-ACP methyl ester carboxylesterase
MLWLYAIVIGIALGVVLGYAAEYVPVAPVLQSVGAAMVAMPVAANAMVILWSLLPTDTGSGGLGAVSVGISSAIFSVVLVAPPLLAAVFHLLLGRLSWLSPRLQDHRPIILGAFGALGGALLVAWTVMEAGRALVAAELTSSSVEQLVSLPASDGGVIVADLYGTGNRGVVLAHGGRFDKSSWKPQARVLADAGFRVLAIDFRAAVQARAGKESPCLYDAECLAVDVLAAVRYLQQTGAKTVAVVGASLGGGAAAQAAVEANEGAIDRVALLAHMPIAAPERMKGRKLFIVAEGDIGSGDIPRLPGIRDQYEKASEPKQLLVLKGSAHAQFIFDTPEGERLLREILMFLLEP